MSVAEGREQLVPNVRRSAKLVMMIYSGNVIVDMSAENRLQFSNWNYTLVHPEKGMVVGNAIKISVNITDTVTKAEIPPDSAWANLWSGQWNDDNIKKSDFRYAWKDYDWATVDAKYDAASALWQPTTTAHAFERTQPANSSQGFPLNSAPRFMVETVFICIPLVVVIMSSGRSEAGQSVLPLLRAIASLGTLVAAASAAGWRTSTRCSRIRTGSSTEEP